MPWTSTNLPVPAATAVIRSPTLTRPSSCDGPLGTRCATSIYPLALLRLAPIPISGEADADSLGCDLGGCAVCAWRTPELRKPKQLQSYRLVRDVSLGEV